MRGGTVGAHYVYYEAGAVQWGMCEKPHPGEKGEEKYYWRERENWEKVFCFRKNQTNKAVFCLVSKKNVGNEWGNLRDLMCKEYWNC